MTEEKKVDGQESAEGAVRDADDERTHPLDEADQIVESPEHGDMIELGKYQRLQADFDNFKRRSRQEMSNMTCLGREQVIEELLGVVDNFSRALDTQTGGLEEFRKGMQLIYRQFEDVLCKHGLAPIEAQGEPFDPEYHQAIMQVDTDKQHEDNLVLQDLQKGYTINGKVIRPSMVKVGKYCEAKGGDNE